MVRHEITITLNIAANVWDFSLFPLYLSVFVVVTFFKMWFLKSSIFFKNVFCESVGNDVFMWLVRVGVRSCTLGSPHTPRMQEYFGVVVVVVVVLNIAANKV